MKVPVSLVKETRIALEEVRKTYEMLYEMEKLDHRNKIIQDINEAYGLRNILDRLGANTENIDNSIKNLESSLDEPLLPNKCSTSLPGLGITLLDNILKRVKEEDEYCEISQSEYKFISDVLKYSIQSMSREVAYYNVSSECPLDEQVEYTINMLKNNESTKSLYESVRSLINESEWNVIKCFLRREEPQHPNLRYAIEQMKDTLGYLQGIYSRLQELTR